MTAIREGLRTGFWRLVAAGLMASALVPACGGGDKKGAAQPDASTSSSNDDPGGGATGDGDPADPGTPLPAGDAGAGDPDAASANQPDTPTPGEPGCAGDRTAVDPATGRCYGLHLSRATWDEASSRCQAEGAALASLDAPGEQALVSALVAQETAWLGASDTATEGSFTWLSGQPFGEPAWSAGQPNDAAAGQDCVELQGDAGGSWNDDRCDLRQPFVCEK